MMKADIKTPSGIRLQISRSGVFHTITLTKGSSSVEKSSTMWSSVQDFMQAATQLAVFLTCNNVPRDFTETVKMLEELK
jgi:hypothetical protein